MALTVVKVPKKGQKTKEEDIIRKKEITRIVDQSQQDRKVLKVFQIVSNLTRSRIMIRGEKGN